MHISAWCEWSSIMPPTSAIILSLLSFSLSQSDLRLFFRYSGSLPPQNQFLPAVLFVGDQPGWINLKGLQAKETSK